MRVTGLAHVALLVLAVLCSGCHPNRSSDGERASPVGDGVPPRRPPSFPAYQLGETHEHHLVAAGHTYRLTLVQAAGTPLPAEELWVHRITKEFPPRSNPEELRAYAKRLGFTGVVPWKKDADYACTGPDGRLAIHLQRPSYLVFTPKAHEVVDRVMSVEAHRAIDKKLSAREMHRIGKAILMDRGVWPANARSACDGSYDTVRTVAGEEMLLFRSFHHSGTLEGIPLAGPSCRLTFSVSCSGSLARFEIAWQESERYALLRTKSVEKAFDDLNRGYAHPLPKELVGGTARFLGVSYRPEPRGGLFIHPVYTFSVEASDVKDVFLVPAIAAEYFEDPKRQVVLDSR